jgi:predicted MFS family arabinose efflux permease
MLKTLWPIFFAYLISQFGNWAFRSGFVYALYDQTGGSNAVLGWTIVLVYVPILLGARFLAPFADKFNSKYTLILVNISRIVILTPLIFISGLENSSSIMGSLILIALLSFCTPIFAAGQSVYIKRNVKEEHVTPSLAVIANIEWFSTIFGTICGPLILLYLNVSNVIFINICALLMSIGIFYLFLKNKDQIERSTTSTVQSNDFKLDIKKLKLVILSIFFLNLGAGVINLYPNFISRDVYAVGEIGLSYVYLANGIGGFIGAMLIIYLRKKYRLIYIACVASILISISLFTMSILTDFKISLLSSSFMLLFGQLFGVGAHAFLLKNTNTANAGKVTGMFQYATFSGVALNAIIYATLLTNPSLKTIFWFMIFCATAAIISTVCLFIYINLQRDLFTREKSQSKIS